MLSVPSWSIKAAKCLRSSLSIPSSAGLGRTKRTLRDAVFRRRCSLAAFWELRNCPADRHHKTSAPGQGNGKAQSPRLPTPRLPQGPLVQWDPSPGEPWAETQAWGHFWGHRVPPRKGSISGPTPGEHRGYIQDEPRLLGGCVLALTEPGSELLSPQPPSAGGIQPIEDKLQLLRAAWEIPLLQFLRTKQIRGKNLPIIQSAGTAVAFDPRRHLHPLPACLSG